MASKSLNQVRLIGNLTRDPELKYTPSGTAVCSFGLATNRSWTTKEGDTKEDVQFHRIVAWQKLAELCANLLSKGRKVYLEGRIVYRQFEGKDGQQKNITEIVMDDFILFDYKTGNESGTPDESQAPANSKAPKADMDDAVAEDEDASNITEDIDPDDIPF